METATQKLNLDIYSFDNYKLFIDEALKVCPEGGRGAYKRLAENLRVHPSRLSQVLRSDEDLSVEQALSVCAFVGLGKSETDYLLFLVERSRSGSRELKKYWQDKITHLRQSQLRIRNRITESRTLSESDCATYYSSWHYQAVRLLCDIPQFQTLKSISLKLGISEEKTQRILEFLVKKGLCTQEGTRYQRTQFSTHLDSGSAFLPQHHRNWRLYHVNQLDTQRESDLHFTCPLTASAEDSRKIRKILLEAIERIDSLILCSQSEALYSINIDFGTV